MFRHIVHGVIAIAAFIVLYFANRHARDLGLEDQNYGVVFSIVFSAIPSGLIFYMLWQRTRKKMASK